MAGSTFTTRIVDRTNELNAPIRTVPAMAPNWPMALMGAPTLPAQAPALVIPHDDAAARAAAFMGANPPSLPAMVTPPPSGEMRSGRFPVDLALTAAMAPQRAAPAPKKQSASLTAPIRQGDPVRDPKDMTAFERDQTARRTAMVDAQTREAKIAEISKQITTGGVLGYFLDRPADVAADAKRLAQIEKLRGGVAPAGGPPAVLAATAKAATAAAAKTSSAAKTSPVSQAVKAATEAPYTAQERALAAVSAILGSPEGFTQSQFRDATGALPGVVSANAKATLQPKQAVIQQAAGLAQEQFGQTVMQADAAVKAGQMSAEEGQAAVAKQRDALMQFLLSLSGSNPANLAMAGMYPQTDAE